MNKTVTNLSLIADAAEYFDRKTGAAWRIRSALTNMLVWSANGLLYANQTNDAERIFKARTELATLRIWAKDANTSSFVLDLTPGAVRKTLGLEREVNVHEEAVRTARLKCIQLRSAARFQQFYKDAVAAHDEQRKVRESRVEEIANMLSDTCFALNNDDVDYMQTFQGMDMRGMESIQDEALYDDGAVERQADQLNETLANVLEAMHDACGAELSAAITTHKVNRLSGYFNAINHMCSIVGIDTKRLEERRQKLDALIEAEIKTVTQSVNDIDNDIESQIAEMTTPCDVQRDEKGRFRRIAKEDLAKEMAKQ